MRATSHALLLCLVVVCHFKVTPAQQAEVRQTPPRIDESEAQPIAVGRLACGELRQRCRLESKKKMYNEAASSIIRTGLQHESVKSSVAVNLAGPDPHFELELEAP